MNKYKININRTPPRPEDIAKLRNFDEVLSNFKGVVKPFYKNLWFITSAAAVLIVGLVGSIFYLSYKSDNDIMASTPFINPTPIAVSYDSYNVNCSENIAFTTPSGTVIKIPQGTLVDAQGNTVKGMVEIKYREFKDAADFICSGIPMTYDSAGTKYFFESAGMFDINAFQASNPLMIANGKNLEVQIASKFNPEDFNQYYLDTANKRWEYCGEANAKTTLPSDSGYKNSKPESINPSTIALNTNTTSNENVQNNEVSTKEEIKVAEIKQEIASIQNTKPVPPVKANPKKTHFNFGYDMKDFPEMAAYNNILFDVGPENKDFKESYYDMTWESVKMEEGPKKGVNFKMTLSRRNQKLELIVYPVFDAKNYDSAKVEYAKMMDNYNKRLNQKKQEEANLIAENNAKLECLKKEAEENEKNRMAQIEQNSIDQVKQNKQREREWLQEYHKTQNFMYVVNVTKMGIWNNDCPRKFKNEQTIYTTCIDENNKEFNPFGDVYLIDKNLNSCIMYHRNNNEKNVTFKIDFDKNSENILVTFNNGKIAIVNAEDFKRYIANGQTKQMKFETQPTAKTVDDVRQLLQL